MKCFDSVPNPAAPIGDPINMRTGSALASLLWTSYVNTAPGTSRVWVVASIWVVASVTVRSSDGSGSIVYPPDCVQGWNSSFAAWNCEEVDQPGADPGRTSPDS